MRSKIVIFLLLLIGFVSFVAGSYGLYDLYDKSSKMEHTVGVVTHVKTEKTYRHRKIYYKRMARIRYETKHYSTHANMQLYNPFIFQGSEVALWYYPEHREEVVIPFEEGFVWGCMGIFGALCLFGGIVIIKKKRYEN